MICQIVRDKSRMVPILLQLRRRQAVTGSASVNAAEYGAESVSYVPPPIRKSPV